MLCTCAHVATVGVKGLISAMSMLCGGCTGAALSGVQVHHTHSVSHELPVPARCRHVPPGRRYSSHLVQRHQHGHDGRGRRLTAVRRLGRERHQVHLQTRKHPHDQRPDMPHVLDLRFAFTCFSCLNAEHVSGAWAEREQHIPDHCSTLFVWLWFRSPLRSVPLNVGIPAHQSASLT